jgi:23S rRNA pseudouridine955/2504/2580 synthase
MKDDPKKVRNKVQKITINKDYSGQRLDNFLLNYLKGVPKSKIYSIIRKGEVRVNSSRKQVFYKIKENDLIRIPPLQIENKENIKAPFELIDVLKRSIIFEDDNCLVINKPFGIASHGGSGISFGLIEAIRNFGPRYRDCKLVHRLDKNTSGCQLVSKNQSFLRKCNNLIREKKIIKKYIALVHGNWPENLNLIENKLTKNIDVSGERLVKVSSDGKNSITKFKLLEKNNFFSKLSCNLVTGRTHQIRVHTSHNDFPIVGDHKYGDKRKDKKFLHQDLKRMYLHSKSLEIKDLNLKVISNEPKEFKKLIKISESKSFLS